MDLFHSYVIRNKNLRVKNRRLCPIEPESNKCVMTGHFSIAGGRYESHDHTYKTLTEFEWSHLSLENLYMAVHRYLTPSTGYKDLTEFEYFTQMYWA
jgi:hypothetical protein